MAHARRTHDTDLVSSVILSGAYCIACIARKTALAPDLVLAALRRMDKQWDEPLIDTAPCAACQSVTTVYRLTFP